MGKFTKPWQFHTDLTEERLRVLASILRFKHDEALEDYDTNKGDTPWGLGVKAFDRSMSTFLRIANVLDWLKIIDESKHLVFLIGTVPARFCKANGDGKPNDNMLWRDQNEIGHYTQSNLPFPEDENPELQDYFWRFVIHKDRDSLFVTGIDLVYVNEEGHVYFSWAVPDDDDVLGVLNSSYKPESPHDVGSSGFRGIPNEDEGKAQ